MKNWVIEYMQDGVCHSTTIGAASQDEAIKFFEDMMELENKVLIVTIRKA